MTERTPKGHKASAADPRSGGSDDWGSETSRKVSKKAGSGSKHDDKHAKKRSKPNGAAKESGAKRQAAAPAHPTAAAAAVVGGAGVDPSFVEELKTEMAALRMQLKAMVEMSAGNMGVAPPRPVEMGELTFEEKRELSARINQLDPDKLAKVVQIIAERMPLGSHSSNEDIEIDIDSLEVVTLRKLQKFVKVRVRFRVLLSCRVCVCVWVCVLLSLTHVLSAFVCRTG